MQKNRISPCEKTHKSILNNGDHLTSMTPKTSNDFELFDPAPRVKNYRSSGVRKSRIHRIKNKVSTTINSAIMPHRTTYHQWLLGLTPA